MDTFGMEPWQVMMHSTYENRGKALGKIVPSPWGKPKDEEDNDD